MVVEKKRQRNITKKNKEQIKKREREKVIGIWINFKKKIR